MADEPKLVVALEARLDKFEKQLREAGLIAEREIAGIERSMAGRDIFTGIAQGIGQQLAKSIQQFAAAIPQMLDEVAKIGDLSDVIGLTTDQIQVMRFALEQSGGTATQADGAMRKFADTVVDAGRGVGSLAKWFEANNVAVKNADGSMKSMNVLLAETARLIQNARSPQEALNLATDAFGRAAGPAMVRALKEGTDGLAAFEAEARAAGIVIDKNLIAQARILDDEFTKLTSTMSSMGKTMAVVVASEFRESMKSMTEQTRTIQLEWRNLALATIDYTRLIPGIGFAFKKEFDAMEAALRRQISLLETTKGALGFAPREAREGPSTPAAAATPTTPTAAPAAKAVSEQKSAVDRLNESMSKSLELSKAELATVGMTVQQQELARQEALIKEAMKRDELTTETAVTQEMHRQAALLAQQRQLLAERTDQHREMLSISKEIGSTLSDAMKGMVLEGKKFDEVLKNIGNRLASKAFDKLFDIMFAAPSGGGGSMFMQLLGIKARMAGGPVSGGSPYMVGERGPELFVPKRSGMIVPNTALGGAGGAGVTIGGSRTAINIEGSADRSTITAMQAMLAERDRRFIADVAGATRELRRRSVAT